MLQKEIYNNLFNKKANISIVKEEKKYNFEDSDGRDNFIEDLQKYLDKNIQSKKFVNTVSKLSGLKINKITNDRESSFILESNIITFDFYAGVKKINTGQFELYFSAFQPKIYNSDKYLNALNTQGHRRHQSFEYVGEQSFTPNWKSFENILSHIEYYLVNFIKEYMLKADIPTEKQSKEVEKSLKEIKKVLKQEYGIEQSILDEKFKKIEDRERFYYEFNLNEDDIIKKYVKKPYLKEKLGYITIRYDLGIKNKNLTYQFRIYASSNDYSYKFSDYIGNLEDLINQIKESSKRIKEI